MQALGDRLDAVYDVTLAYTLHPLAVPTSADADEPRPSEHDLLRGTLPRTVHRDVQLTLTLTVTLILTLTLTLSLTLTLTLTQAAVELSGQKRKAGGAAGRSKRMQLGKG